MNGINKGSTIQSPTMMWHIYIYIYAHIAKYLRFKYTGLVSNDHENVLRLYM